jgi:hypothetical protein
MDRREGEHRDEQEREEFASPGNRDPHHELNNPASEPDPTEWPDPYDKREDPRAPEGSGEPGDAGPPAPGSTSEPAEGRNPDTELRERRGDSSGD